MDSSSILSLVLGCGVTLIQLLSKIFKFHMLLLQGQRICSMENLELSH